AARYGSEPARGVEGFRDDQDLFNILEPCGWTACFLKAFTDGGVTPQQPDDAADYQGDQQRISLLDCLNALGIEATKSFSGCDATGEAQLFVVDHLALHRDREKHAQ